MNSVKNRLPITSLRLQIEIAKTGALCCVAAGPHGEKSVVRGRDHSRDLIEPRWRTNSSFSPPPSRIWDCRIQTDSLLNVPGDSVHGTSASSNGEVSRRGLGSDRYTNHYHSVSEGILSYSGSLLDNVQVPRWTSPIQKINFDSFTTPSIRGSRPETAWLPHSTERQYVASASVASCSYGSSSSLTDSRPCESSGRQPSPLFASCNFSSRRSFMSKPVYPLVIHNPLSDCETIGDADTCSIGRLTPGKDMILPSNWPDISTNIDHKFHKTLTELPKMDTSTDPSSSSRRDGFRWSSASSYDMGFDGENFDVSENIGVESLRSPNYHIGDKKCGVCAKVLWQKSPWGSNRIMRSGDLPIAGILPCSHVFHAECLEQVTPKQQIQDPPCPLCLKTIGLSEDSPPVSEPLLTALRSVRRRRGVTTSDAPEGSSIDEVFNYMKDSTTKISTSSNSQQKASHSLVTNQFNRHLSVKGKTAKDFFSTKVFRRARSSSSIREPVQL